MEKRIYRVTETCPHCEARCARAVISDRIVLYCPECAWDEELEGYPTGPLGGERPPQPRYMLIAEVAEYLEVRPQVVYNMIANHHLPARRLKTQGRPCVIPEWAVERVYLNGWGNDL